MTAILNIPRQSVDGLLIRGIQCGCDHQGVTGELVCARICGQEIDLHIELEQCIVYGSQHVVVCERAAHGESRFDVEPGQRGERLVAGEDCHRIAF